MQFRLYGLLACLAMAPTASAEDFFLTIGGGSSPSGNQASLEKNVLFFQRLLSVRDLKPSRNDIFFSDGDSAGLDLQVMDRDSVPEANRLMAEFFGSKENLGLSYRNHNISNIRGGTSPENIRRWFAEVGSTMRPGDRLLLYVTAHGHRSSHRDDPYDTTIATWNNTSIKMTELVRLLDGLPCEVDVVAIMVQCHSGGFSHFIYKDGDPAKGLSPQRRVGFFATVHDRAAAGCTADIDEAGYVEYSTYFWAALGGRNRLGDPIEMPDYNGDGTVTFDEAHAYTILTADTIDLPIKTSDEYLTTHSKFGDGKSDLLANDESYALILKLATPTQQVILEGLSDQLGLTGDDRIVDAWKATQSSEGGRPSGRGRFRGRRPPSRVDQIRGRIASDLKRRWPELANVLNPLAIEFLTTRSDEFIEAVKGHAQYAQYRQLAEASSSSERKRKVKYERFLRISNNVALAENLRRVGDAQRLAEYEAILTAEAGRLTQ